MDPHIQIISETKDIEEDKNLFKIIFLLFANLILATGLFYFFRNYLQNVNATNFWFLILFLVLFLSAEVLNVLFIKKKWIVFLFTLLSFLMPPFFVFFNEIKTLPLSTLQTSLYVFIISLLIIFSAQRKGIVLLENSIDIKFFFISKVVLKKLTTGLLIFLLLLIYLIYFVWNIGDQKLAQKLVENIVEQSKWFNKWGLFDLSFTPQSSMSEVLRKITISSLQDKELTDKEMGLKIYFSKLPDNVKEELIKKYEVELSKKIKEQFPFFKEDMTVNDFVFQLFGYYFKEFEEKWKEYFYIALLAIVFFVLKGLFGLFYWFISLVAFLIYKMLIVVGFAYETTEMRSRKYVVLN